MGKGSLSDVRESAVRCKERAGAVAPTDPAELDRWQSVRFLADWVVGLIDGKGDLSQAEGIVHRLSHGLTEHPDDAP